MKSIIIICFFIFQLTSLHADTLFFIHGGPGLNSEPENQLLKPYLDSKQYTSYFWNEPSKLRSPPRQNNYKTKLKVEGISYSDTLKSLYSYFKGICNLEKSVEGNCKITVIAHSFGTVLAKELLLAFPQNIKKLILIAPVYNLNLADKQILKLAAKGLINESKVEYGEKILALLPKLNTAFDANKIQAFNIALQYTSLFSHYFHSQVNLNRYFSYLANDYQFDLDNFFNIRITMPKISIDRLEIPIEEKISVHAYFGETDPISNMEQQYPILKKTFKNLKITRVPHAGHFVHLEAMDIIKW